MPQPDSRRYLAQRLSLFMRWPILIGSVACLVVVVADRVSIFGILFVALMVLIVAWIGFVALERHVGNETPTGFQAGVFRKGLAIVAPWSDIECFEALGPKSIYLRMRSGRRYLLLGINQQYVTRWEGGSTDDIVGELNRRLALWQRWASESELR